MPDPQNTIIAGAPPIGSKGGIAILTDRIKQIEEAEFVLDFIERSRVYREPFVPIWDEIQDNYFVVPFGGAPSDALSALLGLRTSGVMRRTNEVMSRLKDPETHQVIETLTSQAIGLLLGSDQFIRALPIGVDDPEKARLLSRLLMASFDQPGVFRTNYELIKSAYTFGTAYVILGWETREREQEVLKPIIDPYTGAIVGQTTVRDNVIYRDRLLWRTIGIRDFYPDPNGTRIHQDMSGCGYKFRTNKWKAKELIDANVYDREATMRVIKDKMTNTPVQQGYGDVPFPRMANLLGPDKYAQMNGLEWWGEVPFRRAGGRNRVITLLDGMWVRGGPNPFIDGDIPIKEIVINPVGGRHYGLSPAEVIRFLQDSTDNFLMLFTDAGDLAIRSPILLGQAFGGNEEQIRQRKINDVIKCRNVDAVKPLPFDATPLTFAASEMARRIMRMREASGATNPLQAVPADKEQTATETNALLRLASQRVTTAVQLIEREDYPWIGRTIHSRLRQFAEPDIVASLAGDVFHVKLEDINLEADVRFVGSHSGGDPGVIAASTTAVLNMLAAAPPQLVVMYPDLLVRLIRDGMKMADGELIVQKAVMIAQGQMQQEQMMQQQQAASKGKPASQKRGGTPQTPQTDKAVPAETAGEALQ